jgi:glycosyltransferase involved in cell wall biosynthesis
MEISLSVALVTRNRPASLANTLLSLSRQDVQPSEVVISDDSNEPFSLEVNRQLAEKYGCRHIQGPNKGLYANRNFALKACNGTHIRTMDDDHEFPEGHLEICLDAIRLDPDAIWTIGEYSTQDLIMPLPAPVPGQLHPRGYSYQPGDMKSYFGISCGSSIYPRKILLSGIFNIEHFRYGMTYLEYGARLASKGFLIRHLSTTYVIHHQHETDQSIATIRSGPALQTINSARVFSMLMLSFHYQKTLKNKLHTTFQITREMMARKLSVSLLLDAYGHFKRETKHQNEIAH